MSEKDINFENKLWKAADKLRKKVEVHEYKYVVLGLIFLRYISFAFEEKQREIVKETDKELLDKFRDDILEDKDMYLSDGILYVPEKARWDYIKKNANQPNIGEVLDEAIEILEKEYPKQLKSVIPKIYTKINLSSDDLAYLINVCPQLNLVMGIKARIYLEGYMNTSWESLPKRKARKAGSFILREV